MISFERIRRRGCALAVSAGLLGLLLLAVYEIAPWAANHYGFALPIPGGLPEYSLGPFTELCRQFASGIHGGSTGAAATFADGVATQHVLDHIRQTHG